MPGVLIRVGWTRWRLCGAIVVLGLAGVATWSCWIGLARTMLSVPGMICIPTALLAAAWLIGVRRQRVRLCRPGGHLAAPLIVLAGGGLYHLGSTAAATSAPALTAGVYLGGFLVMFGAVMAVCWEAVRQFLAAAGALALALCLPMFMEAGGIALGQEAVAGLIWTLSHLLGGAGGATMPTADHANLAVAEVGGGWALALTLCLVIYAVAFSHPWPWPVRAWWIALAPAVVLISGVVGTAITVWLVARTTPAIGLSTQLLQWTMFAFGLIVLAALLRLMAWASMGLRLYARAALDQ